MTSNKRLFIALMLPEQIKQQIDHWRTTNLTISDKNPVPSANYHITLVFLGHTPPAIEQQLCAALDRWHPPRFQLTFNQIGHWPRPKVLYLAPANTPAILKQLQCDTNNLVESLGLQADQRFYQPHITLFRSINEQRFHQVSRLFEPQQLVSSQQAELKNPSKPNIVVDVTHFALFESVSSENGVHYSVTKQWPLG